MVTEVAHGLLDALGEGLSCALHVDRQRDPEYIPVLIVWNLDPFHELGHSPIEKILELGGIRLLVLCTFCPSLQVSPVGSRSVLIRWLFKFKLNKITNSVPQSYQPHFKCSIAICGW